MLHFPGNLLSIIIRKHSRELESACELSPLYPVAEESPMTPTNSFLDTCNRLFRIAFVCRWENVKFIRA